MKSSLITLLSVVVLGLTVRADSTVTLTGVHNCCKSCTNGINKAISSVAGATCKVDNGTVTVTAKNTTDSKKAVAALLDAGYFGEGAKAATASDGKVKSVTVTGIHLCCGKCVDAFNKAATEAGATKTDAAKNAKSVAIEGDFSPKEVLAAMNKAGFNGKVK